jgi:hypothetical protein
MGTQIAVAAGQQVVGLRLPNDSNRRDFRPVLTNPGNKAKAVLGRCPPASFLAMARVNVPNRERWLPDQLPLVGGPKSCSVEGPSRTPERTSNSTGIFSGP